MPNNDLTSKNDVIALLKEKNGYYLRVCVNDKYLSIKIQEDAGNKELGNALMSLGNSVLNENKQEPVKKITPLVCSKPKEEVIRVLRNLLTEAERGELLTIASVSLYKGEDTSHGWSGVGKNLLLVLGEMRLLEFSLISSVMDDDHTIK